MNARQPPAQEPARHPHRSPTAMTTTPTTTPTIDDRLAVYTAAADRMAIAHTRVINAEKALDEARAELRAAQQARPRRDGRRNLARMQELVAGGAQVVTVTADGYPGSRYPGVVVKATEARVTVLTELGEMVFDRKARAYDPPGAGRGDHRGYSINVEELAD